MATPRPRRPPAMDPVGGPDLDPAVDPVGDPELDPAVDPVGDPEVDPPPAISQGQEDLSQNRDPVVGAMSTPVCISPHGDQLPDLRRQNILKHFVSEFLDIPLKKMSATFEIYPALGMQKGFLSYFAHAPVSAMLSSEEEEPSKFDKFSKWFMKNVDPDDVFMKKFVKMILELNGISIEISPGSQAMVSSRLYPSLKAILQYVKPIQTQSATVKQTISKIKISSAEGEKSLGEIQDTTSMVDNLVKEAVKAIDNAEKKGAAEEAESIVVTFIEKLKKAENHDLSNALKQVDKMSQLADIPVSVKKRLEEMKGQLKLLRSLMSAALTAWGIKTLKPTPEGPVTAFDPTGKAVSGNPGNETLKPVPCTMAPVIPFHKLGKGARDVLYKNYLGEAPFHCEMLSLFGKGLNPSLSVKARSTTPEVGAVVEPAELWGSILKGEVCAVLKHEELWGSKLKGNLRFVLPFKNRLDGNGLEVPLKQTSVGKLLYFHERACLSATIGLYANPAVSLSGMFGTTAPFFGTTSVSGGGRLSFISSNGTVTGIDAGLSLTNPEWGTVSATASLLENHRGVKVFYNQKVLKQNTIAAELNYNHQDGTVVVSAGLEHQYDRAVLLKAMVKSDGIAQAMVETKEGIAGSTVRAC